MIISYSWLQSYFKDKLPLPEKLAKILTLHSFETDVRIPHSAVRSPQSVVRNPQSAILDVDVLPNRAHDCLSYLGIARECAALLKLKITNKNSKLITNDYLKVSVKDSALCPRYTALMITGVKVGPSPKWIRDRLEAMGQKSINNIVDATNYVMFETGQPLHAFDLDKIESVQNQKSKIPCLPAGRKNQKYKSNIKNIVIRKARKGEKITTLDGQNIDLDEDVLVIADAKEPLAIAGIKGGKKAEIAQDTKNIILEAANFDASNIRKTSKKLGIRTESSIRFEYGIDPNLTGEAMAKLVHLIVSVAGGYVVDGEQDLYPKKLYPKIIKLDLVRVNSVLGVEIKENEVKNILEGLGCRIKRFFKNRKVSSRFFDVEVPTSRLDITIAEDLIEEIGRIYGYEKIPVAAPSALLKPARKDDKIYWRERLSDFLKGMGFSEAINYSLIGAASIEELDSLILELANPVSEDRKYLRPSMMPGILANIRSNQNFFENIKLFEVGRVYVKKLKIKNQKSKTQIKNEKDVSVEETMKVAGVISSRNHAARELFYEMKGVVDGFLESFGLSDVWYDEFFPEFGRNYRVSKFFNPKMSAQIKIGNDMIGWVGEIDSAISDIFGIKHRVVGFEIDFAKLAELASEEHIYYPIAKYPEVVRDIALLVPREIKIDDVLNKIEEAGGALVRDADVFDIYEGEDLPAGRQDWPDGKKNLAFHIILQADDHTLTSKEIDGVMMKIKQALEQEGEWEVRK